MTLMADDAHQIHQKDGEAVDRGTEEHASFRRFVRFCRKGPLPHLRTGQSEHQIGDDVPHDAAVDVRLRQFRREVRGEVRPASHVMYGGGGDEDVYEQKQHVELEYIREHHTEQAGGGGVEHEDNARDHGAGFIGDAHIAAQHLDDGGGGGDLRGHGAHHGKGYHAGQNDLCRLAEPLFKQFRHGGDVIPRSHAGDPSGDPGEDKHADEIRQGGGDRHGTEAVCFSCSSHQSAAANDRGADGGHQDEGAEGTSGYVVVFRSLDTTDEIQADTDHSHQIDSDDDKVQGAKD